MALEHEIRTYRECWKAVEAVQADERRAASVELRWRQLNAVYGMAKALGLLQTDPSEMGVHTRWANLKNQIIPRPPKS